MTSPSVMTIVCCKLKLAIIRKHTPFKIFGDKMQKCCWLIWQSRWWFLIKLCDGLNLKITTNTFRWFTFNLKMCLYLYVEQMKYFMSVDWLSGYFSLFKLLGCWIHNKNHSYVSVLCSHEQSGMKWNYWTEHHSVRGRMCSLGLKSLH